MATNGFPRRSSWSSGLATSCAADLGTILYEGVWEFELVRFNGIARRALETRESYPQVIHKILVLRGSLGVCPDHGAQVEVLEPSFVYPGHRIKGLLGQFLGLGP